MRQVTDLASNIIRLGKNGSGPAEMISLAENELARSGFRIALGVFDSFHHRS